MESHLTARDSTWRRAVAPLTHCAMRGRWAEGKTGNRPLTPPLRREWPTCVLQQDEWLTQMGRRVGCLLPPAHSVWLGFRQPDRFNRVSKKGWELGENHLLAGLGERLGTFSGVAAIFRSSSLQGSCSTRLSNLIMCLCKRESTIDHAS